MLAELGLFSIILAFTLALLQIIIYNTKIGALQIMRPVALGQAFFCSLAFVFLALCFINNDFSVLFIAQNSNSSLPFYYKIPAIWSAHEGSLLLWIFIVSLWALLLCSRSQKWTRDFSNAVLLIFALVNAGLLGILLYKSNPFARNFSNIPIDGQDLNPLLQDIGMILHPPILYLGYVGSTIGFAFACAALLTRRIDSNWATALRPWALMTWMFLTLGIALGSWWAYYELGWGGWWFWDPVENAALMPWLTNTALLHTLIVAKKNGQLLWLAVFLAIASFMLSLCGTFLVRSGSIVSVHAFAADPQRGLLFLLLILSLCFLVLWWLVTHLRNMQTSIVTVNSTQRLTIFMLANSLLLLVATGTILLGTLFPLVAEFFGSDALTVGAPYFNLVFAPIMLILLTLMLQYFSASKIFWLVLFSAVCSVLFLYVNFQQIHFNAWLAVTVACAMILVACKRGSLSMQFAHIGLAIMLFGIGITPAYEIEKDVRLNVGAVVELYKFTVQFVGINSIEGANYVGYKGTFNIKQNAKPNHTIYPEKRTYLFPQVSMSETAILPGIRQDIYIALGQKFANDSWAVRIYYKPYIRCIWLGALVMALGALAGIFAARARLKSDH